MWPGLLHALVGILGVVLLYAGLFLTEDEERNLQNRLEELWIRVDDLEAKALKRQTVLLQEASALAAEGITKIFGQRLFSAASAASCLCFAMASVYLSLAIFSPRSSSFPIRATLPAAIIFIWFGFSRTLRYVGASLLILGGLLALVASGVARGYHMSFGGLLSALLGYAIGVLIVIASVTLIRTSLSLAAKTSSLAWIVLLTAADLMLAALLVSPLLIAGFAAKFGTVCAICVKAVRWPGMVYLYSLSGTTLLAASLALTVFLVLIAAVIHRIVWPFTSRIIYAAHRHGLVIPGWLKSRGSACLVFAWPNNVLVEDILGAIRHIGL